MDDCRGLITGAALFAAFLFVELVIAKSGLYERTLKGRSDFMLSKGVQPDDAIQRAAGRGVVVLSVIGFVLCVGGVIWCLV